MVNSKKKPSYKLISTYKTELMGVASISVLIGHAGTAIIADTGVVSLIPKIATLICTLMYMFFFLSGFGCYYSLNKSNNTRRFYANRIKKVLLPYLEISLIAYAIKYFVLEFSVSKFIKAMFFISFWVKNEGAWYIAVVLILYVIYPLLYNIQKSPKGKLNIIALLLIILCITLVLGYIKEPWKYNVNYSYIGHFGGPLMGALCFIVGSLVAEKSLNLNKYSYLLIMIMAMIWPLSKLNPITRYSSSISLIASVFLGMSGVFILPLGFQRMSQGIKEKSLSFLRIMGGATLELYLTNIYVNDLLSQLNFSFPNDQYRIKYSIFFTTLGVLLTIILIKGKKSIKHLYAK